MKISATLEKSLPFITLGAVFLFWEGFLFLVAYFQRFSISVSLSDFTLQEVFISGASPFLMLLLWVSKKILFFDYWLKPFLLSAESINRALILDSLAIGLPILIILFIYKILFLLRVLINYIYSFLRQKNPFVFFVKIIKWRGVGKNILFLFFMIFVLFFLPRWAGLTAKTLGYPLFFGGHPEINLVYQGPEITPEDICENNICLGIKYTKLFEGKEYLYLLPGNKCIEIEKVVYYDSGPGGSKIITNMGNKEKRTCDSIALPKNRILNIINLPSRTMLPN